MGQIPLIVLNQIQEHIIPLSAEEYQQLEEKIINAGYADPIGVWPADEGLVIVEGLDRHKICQKLNIAFDLKIQSFEDIEHVILFIADDHLNRKNLTSDQRSYYRGLKYIGLRNKKGGFANIRAKGRHESTTSEVLANQFKVSNSTIKRDAKFAEGLNLLGKINRDLKMEILTGKVKIKKSDIQTAAAFGDPALILQKLEGKRFSDLSNWPTADSSQESSKKSNLKSIKSRMSYVINRLISNPKKEDIAQLRLLIEDLDHEIFNSYEDKPEFKYSPGSGKSNFVHLRERGS